MGTGRGEPLWLRDEGRGLHTQECGRMGAGRAGPAARAWCLVCVSGGSCVCCLLSWGRLGCPARNTGLPGTPLPPRGCPPRLPSKQLILGQVGAVSAGGHAPFLQKPRLPGLCRRRSRGSAFRAGRLLCFWQPVLLSRRCPAGSLCTQECGERGPATPPPPTQLGFPTPAPASAPSGAQWDPR